MGFVFLIVIAFFLAGFAVAGRWCSHIITQIIVGIVLGAGFVVVLCGVLFAGCVFMMNGRF